MKKIIIHTPATIANLGPGFDVIGLALNVFNRTEVYISDENRDIVRVYGQGSGELSEDGENLLLKTYNKVVDKLQLKRKFISIHQYNTIPPARGMGSSASAVAAGLMLAKKLYGEAVSDDIIENLAVEIEGHPDNVMAALKGGIIINYMQGDRYQWQKIIPPSPVNIVLVVPENKISTREARKVLPEYYSINDVVKNLQNMALLIQAFSSGKYNLLRWAMEDYIHEPYRAPMIKGYNEARKAALKYGAYGCCISGSGSATAAFCGDNYEEVAHEMQKVFKKFHAITGVFYSTVNNTGAFANVV